MYCKYSVAAISRRPVCIANTMAAISRRPVCIANTVWPL